MKLIRLAAAGSLLAIAASVAANPQAATSPASAPATIAAAPQLEAADLAAWLDGRVPYALKSGDIAGAVIVVVKDGKVLLQKGYGYADVAAKTSMDPETTMVRPGSTSKLFTWTAVMQLVQQGKLDLDRNVNDYLDFKIEERFGKPITLRDLMNHRAGFEEGLKDVLAYDPKQAQTTEQYLKQHPRPMLFAPGQVPAYSNYGVALAGYIVQRVSGEPFERYVERHVFQPLGMMHSTMAHPLPERFQKLAAQGYRQASDDKPSPFEFITTAPAGSATMTAADMARFMLAHLQQGSLDSYAMLSPATTALMHSPSQPPGPAGFAVMAHGFFSGTQNGRTVIGHGGDTIVFHTEMNLLPQEGVGIFFSFNSRGKDAAVYGARKELFDGFMDRYFPAPPQAEPPALASAAADAQRIAGRYQSSRRIENGFLSALYLMSQTVITAKSDGTITVPNFMGGSDDFREIAPQRWRKIGGAQELLLSEVDGVKTVIDSENPVSVLQEASFLRSAPLTLTLLSLSVLVLLGTLLIWPIGALLRRADRASSGASPAVQRLRRWQRIAVAVDAVYLLAWLLLIQPVLNTDLAIYNSANDGLIGALQIAGLAPVAAAVVGVGAAWRMQASDASRLSRIWSLLVAAALLGVVWIGVVGQLMSWNLNY
ncbi:serine hydrolase domain-containing protein [Roseateles violae]|uniref:Serine hydrolase domain-containing protein n=1 Tax=Roseateles violae TaxID=3058042 RepID=A0ABT8DUZ6_9BURK|nr:serine hydrolase domain-containing protein [Pelomonas sp. PFR6]MDN3922130.1 serine hydrolase domain-containing protein [Pelomonas sp. PFR6]